METTTRNEEIRRKRQAGTSLQELADEFGVSRQRILQIAPDGPPEPRIDKKAATAAIKRAMKAAAEIAKARQAMSDHAELRADAIRQALAAGMSQADVARALGVGTSAINNALRQH